MPLYLQSKNLVCQICCISWDRPVAIAKIWRAATPLTTDFGKQSDKLLLGKTWCNVGK